MPRITIEQKLHLRQWFNDQDPKPTQADAIRWFKDKYGHILPQYQISRILTSKTLKTVTLNSPGIDRTRVHAPQWPVLEELLKRWQIAMEIRGINTTRLRLMEKAKDIWVQYPQARNNEPPHPIPQFGPSWCTLFQQRYRMNNRVFRGARAAAGPAPNLSEAKEKMLHLQKLMAETPRGNCYNMSQMGLLWRRSPSSEANVPAETGKRRDRRRISVAITTNDTGDDKTDLWVVGKAACPRALARFNWQAHRTVWRHNAKAWLTTPIMKQWYEAFYTHIRTVKPGQKVLLLLDNFSPYVEALKEAPPPDNITVEFFPVHTASMYQPNTMGVVSMLKAHYRRSFLEWMCSLAEDNNQRSDESPVSDDNDSSSSSQDSDDNQVSDDAPGDPVDQMTLRLAIGWLSYHWFATIKPETIRRCWINSALLGTHSGYYDARQEYPNDLQTLYGRATAEMPDKMSLMSFLNPEHEDMPPDEPSTDTQVLEQVLQDWALQSDYREPEEIEEETLQPEVPTVSLHEGLANVTNLITSAESNKLFSASQLHSLQLIKQCIATSIEASTRQDTLDS